MNPSTESTAIERLRALAASCRAGDPTAPYPAKQGRGLVVVAGGAQIFTCAYVLIHVLRHALRSTMKIELWHFGQAEISAAMAAMLAPLDVTLVDALPIIAARGSSIRDGWQLKSFAIENSSFRDVLLLDADQVPTVDPVVLFEWPEYREVGAVFWPDAVDIRRTNEVWAALDLPPRREISLESGQILVDSVRHAAAIAAAVRLNEAADDLYKLIYGDKDTYLLAWELTGAQLSLVPHRPYTDMLMFVQRDFAGNPLFQHRTNAKWIHGGAQRQLVPFVHEEACEAALAALARGWGGRVFTAPDRSAEARAIESTMVAQGAHSLRAGDEPPIRLGLAAHSEFSEGRSADRQHWWIECSGGTTSLILSDGERRTYSFDRTPDGIWVGRRLRLPVAEASLCPLSESEPPIASDCPGIVDDILRAAGALSRDCPRLAELAVTLRLLAEVVPDVGARLERLAERATDQSIATRLRSLAGNAGRPMTAIATDWSSKLDTGYVKAELGE